MNSQPQFQTTTPHAATSGGNPLASAMRLYALTTKEQFPSHDPATQDQREGTTFYADFKVAEAFLDSEPNALNDTWKRSWEGWKNNCKYMVEICIVMNHLCWEHAGHDAYLCDWYARKYHYIYSRIFSSGSEEEPLPDGCKPFTEAEHTFAFNVLD